MTKQKVSKVPPGEKRVTPFFLKGKVVFFAILFAVLIYTLRGFFLAAVVDGTVLSRFQLIAELEKRYGEIVLDELITLKIIEREARRQNITVSQQELDSEVSSISSQIGQQGSTLEEALAQRGQTVEDLKNNLKTQLTLEKLLGGVIEVSEEEVLGYFEENKESFGPEAKFEEIKEDLTIQLKQQKLGVEFEKWISEKKASDRIIRFVNFN